MSIRKYINKIPPGILDQIALSKCTTVRVGKRFAVGSQELLVMAKRFCLTITDTDVKSDEPIPSGATGSWSKKNVNGWVQIHRELPKEPFSYWITTPNFGDPSKGYHDILMQRERYPRSHHGPKLIAFEFSLEVENDKQFVMCSLDRSLPIGIPNFQEELFFHLNLFCENCGSIDVLLDEKLTTQKVTKVDWEIFPSLSLEEIQDLLTKNIYDPTKRRQIQDVVAARHRFFKSLQPSSIIIGSDAFTRYFGAVVTNKIVVFECVNYGNALYILGENWTSLTQLSRNQLLNTPELEFIRVVHVGQWEQKVRQEVLRLIRDLEQKDDLDEPDAGQAAAV